MPRQVIPKWAFDRGVREHFAGSAVRVSWRGLGIAWISRRPKGARAAELVEGAGVLALLGDVFGMAVTSAELDPTTILLTAAQLDRKRATIAATHGLPAELPAADWSSRGEQGRNALAALEAYERQHVAVVLAGNDADSPTVERTTVTTERR